MTGPSMPSMTTGPSHLGGVEHGTSVPRSSADTTVIPRITQADAWVFSSARFPPNLAPTRQMSFAATSPPDRLTRRKLWGHSSSTDRPGEPRRRDRVARRWPRKLTRAHAHSRPATRSGPGRARAPRHVSGSDVRTCHSVLARTRQSRRPSPPHRGCMIMRRGLPVNARICYQVCVPLAGVRVAGSSMSWVRRGRDFRMATTSGRQLTACRGRWVPVPVTAGQESPGHPGNPAPAPC